MAHDEGQTEDEQFAEIEAAREAENVTLMAVPTKLVPEVRRESMLAVEKTHHGLLGMVGFQARPSTR